MDPFFDLNKTVVIELSLESVFTRTSDRKQFTVITLSFGTDRPLQTVRKGHTYSNILDTSERSKIEYFKY